MSKIAVITGSSRGIGFAVAEVFAKNGFDLVLNGKNPEKLEEAIDALSSQYSDIQVEGFAADLGNQHECKDFVEKTLETHPQIDVLVNNAGVFLPGTLMDEDDDQMHFQMQTNFFSAYHVTKGLWNALKKNERSHVFNMCSIASIMAYDAGGGYAVTKHALLGFSKSLRREGITKGIRVTSVMPGATYTDSWASIDLPKSRFMKVEDVAKSIWAAYDINLHTNMEEVVLRPIEGDI